MPLFQKLNFYRLSQILIPKNTVLTSEISHKIFSSRGLRPSVDSWNHRYTVVKERLCDKFILFNHLLHMQSNVYLTLQLRRINQLRLLYRRIYSPAELQNLFESLVINLRLYQLFYAGYRECIRKWLTRRRRLLLGFATFGVFSWDENRITEQEFDALMEDFVLLQKEHHRQRNGDGQDTENPENRSSNENGSLKVVNCMPTDNTSLVTEWEEIIHKPNFQVWRKSVNNTALYEYKVFGSFDDISAYSFYLVQKDLDYRKEWDHLVVKLEIVDVEPPGETAKAPLSSSSCKKKAIYETSNELVHWIMKYPYPMMNREYLFIRKSRIDHERNAIILISKAVPAEHIPESGDHVRVYDYTSRMVIKPLKQFDQPGFEFMLTYFDDPRASFPSPAYAWMAARGVPDFVESLHQAAVAFSRKKLTGTAESDDLYQYFMPDAFTENHHDNDETHSYQNDTVDDDTTSSDLSSETEKPRIMKKIVSKLPEPQLHYDSLIWN